MPRQNLLGLTHWFCLSAFFLFGLALAQPPHSVDGQKKKVDFSQDILPILSEKCFACHGPDSQTRKAGLRLDLPTGSMKVIQKGKPGKSVLVERITSKSDPMPPESSHKTLSEAEKSLIISWITQGAEYAKLWSFEPIPKFINYPMQNDPWIKVPWDGFVLKSMREHGLEPSREASKERWLRRVTYDLTGLPPSDQERVNFLNDHSDHSFETVVDRLLASPRFGERMAVDWLDAARYSDSYGYQSDLIAPNWPYRDWVVRALNQNMPFSEFVTLQLAGDQVPNATAETHLATAFNRLHRQSNEGGSIRDEFKMLYAADRTDTFGTAVLGLTLGCARCHDHKYDPISQREYYQLFAYFNAINEFGLLLSSEIVPTPSVLLPTVHQKVELEQLKKIANETIKSYQSAKQKIALASDFAPRVTAQFDDQGKNQLDSKATLQQLGTNKREKSPFGLSYVFDGDSGLKIENFNSADRWDAFSWSFALKNAVNSSVPTVILHRTGGTDVGFCGMDLTLDSGHLVAKIMRHWPGNAIAIRTLDTLPEGVWTQVAWTYDGSGTAQGLALFLNGKKVRYQVIANKIWKNARAYGDLGPGQGHWTFATRFRDAGFKNGAVARVQYFEGEWLPEEVKSLHSGYKGNSTKPFNSHFEELGLAMRAQQKKLAEFENGILEVSTMEDQKPLPETYLLARGQYDSPKKIEDLVHRNVPECLSKPNSKELQTRLGLAKWVCSPKNPLTSRVAVNRLWQLLFGTGIVETSENFGVQGSRPTHPELLDALAYRFLKSGWNTKALLREMALSATYRQDSKGDLNNVQVDPLNRWLSRGPSQRLSSEMIRDGVLFAAGLLQEKMGGPPVNPYQPAGIWTENNTMSPEFVQSKGEDLYRRSLYSTWKRTTPVPNMTLFDAPGREACTMRRTKTNTPLQSLVLLNDIQFVEASRALADRVLVESHSDGERIQRAFLLLCSRFPSNQESVILNDLLLQQRQIYGRDLLLSQKAVAIGGYRNRSGEPAQELASWMAVCQVIMNSDSAVWKR